MDEDYHPPHLYTSIGDELFCFTIRIGVHEGLSYQWNWCDVEMGPYKSEGTLSWLQIALKIFSPNLSGSYGCKEDLNLSLFI